MLVALLVAGALAAPPAPARYSPFDDYRLALQAELIVEATVVEVDRRDPSTSIFDAWQDRPRIVLRVEDVLAGETDAKRLTATQFVDWSCASRHVPYAVGQRSVFHLERQRDEHRRIVPDAPWRPMGSGNEGEFAVTDDGTVLMSRLCRRTRDARPSKTVEVHGGSFTGIPVSRAEYAAAVRGLRRCWRWRVDASGPSYDARRLEPTCEDDERAAFRASSPTARELATHLEDAIERDRR